MARLIFEAEAKASLKRRESYEYDPKPDDLLVGRTKFLEREMEVRTVIVNTHSDDLRVGVKSQSSSAMAGSYRNMPQYSLVMFVSEVQYGSGLQSLMTTEPIPTQNLLTAYSRNGGQCVRYCSETGTTETEVKVPKRMLSVSNFVLNLRH